MSYSSESKPAINPIGQRELIVVSSGLQSASPAAIDPLTAVLSQHQATLQPLFGVSPQQIQAEAAALAPSTASEVPDLSVYYSVQAPDAKLEAIAAELRAQNLVDAAYIKPPAEAAIATPLEANTLYDMVPRSDEAPPTTPDFVSSQVYLGPAPAGIDARFAWTQPGGGGAGVNIIDCEWNWNVSHEDLGTNQGGVVVGSAGADDNHGTAVAGEMGGDRNGVGVTGICPEAFIRFAAFSQPTASVIRQAANLLNAGDLLLLEIHRAGPGANGVGQDGYIAVEWWPDDYDAIRYACSRGVIVVEAAGNGFRDIDNAIYDTRPTGFPSSWSNPFRRGARDSGAILVGAGAPPPGTHGVNWGADRSRLDFSNYGAAVDVQGWGREVTTTGYGDLQGGSNRNVWYTNTFSGTSSASPIVTGALACVQGILRARGRIPLSPARARELLRSTGSPQQDEPGRPATQRIGNRPDLVQLIAAAVQTSSFGGTQFTGSLTANQTSRWFTFDWPAHWHVMWTVMPTSPFATAGQIRWRVLVQRASFDHITYWIEVANLTGNPVTFEARYNVVGW